MTTKHETQRVPGRCGRVGAGLPPSIDREKRAGATRDQRTHPCSLWLGLLGLAAAPVLALSPLSSVTASPDTTVTLGGATVRDHQMATDDLGGTVMVISLGSLPEAAAVDAFHAFLDGQMLFSLATPVDLAGTTFAPGDVVRWDGIVYTLELDAAAAGLPAGVNVDAVAVDGADLLLSFDITVDLSGGIVADHDLVRWNGAVFAPFFDGSLAGVPDALDVDGAHLLTTGNLLLSMDGAGDLGGVSFADEDALEYDPTTGIWELAFDGSALHSDWVAGDLAALAAREPAQIPIFGSLQFSSPTYVINEVVPMASITVTRTGGAQGSVTVTYTTTDGTATAGADYTAATGTLAWADGDAAPKVFDVPILDDSAVEGDETVLLDLSNPSGGAVIGAPGMAVLTIIDNESAPYPLGIPVLGPWGVVLFGFLLGASGLVAIRRTLGG